MPISNVEVTNTVINSDIINDVPITCRTVSRPAATITWMKIGRGDTRQDITFSSEIVTNGSLSIIPVSSTLTFRFSASDNGGYIYCSANNNASTKNSSFINLNIKCEFNSLANTRINRSWITKKQIVKLAYIKNYS